MSVIIRGMDIPKDCNHCRFVNLETAGCMALCDEMSAVILSNERPRFCPLIGFDRVYIKPASKEDLDKMASLIEQHIFYGDSMTCLSKNLAE